jgi:hypothetical protein
MDLVSWLFEPFASSFMQRAFISSLAIGITAPVIGVWAVYKRLVYLTDAMSHSILAGVAAAAGGEGASGAGGGGAGKGAAAIGGGEAAGARAASALGSSTGGGAVNIVGASDLREVGMREPLAG